MPILVIILIFGSMQFVASKRPPKPVSITQILQFLALKCTKESTKVISKKDGSKSSFKVLIFVQKEITSASVIFFPLTRILSRKSKICGEVKSPTFSPNSVSIDAV